MRTSLGRVPGSAAPSTRHGPRDVSSPKHCNIPTAISRGITLGEKAGGALPLATPLGARRAPAPRAPRPPSPAQAPRPPRNHGSRHGERDRLANGQGSARQAPPGRRGSRAGEGRRPGLLGRPSSRPRPRRARGGVARGARCAHTTFSRRRGTHTSTIPTTPIARLRGGITSYPHP